MAKDTPPDHRAESRTSVRPINIRGRFLTAVALKIDGGLPDDDFYAALDDMLRQRPHFLVDAPLILDLDGADSLTRSTEMKDLVANLKARKFNAFGVQNASDMQLAAAEEAGLIAVPPGRDAPLRDDRPERRRSAGTTEKQPTAVTRTVTVPIRSGQTVVAEHGDLVVIGPVASGAELIARGNIHIYGTLRGRAMAGCHGDTEARIFCQNMDAELLAVAGLYRTSENLGQEIRKRSVQVFLQDERLCVETLG
ncbi:MAG: septum site-determining protein MinC [Rhodobacterales bacterium]|uniref:septum site-determining protein MinC n=1 Tax=Puniceibacterium antarcticum TaxID=1206336 RepID=UPI003183EA90